MASYRYNTYRRYTAAYRVVKLQAKDKPFSCLPLTPGCFYRRNIYLASTCVQSGYCSHSFRYCQNNYRTSFLTPVLWHKKSPEGLMRFNVIFSRYHYIWDTCVLHLIKISHKRNVKISVYLFKDSFRVYFYISRSEHVEFFFHSDKIFPDQFFGYYTIRMRIHRQTVSGIPPWFLQMRKLF